MTYSDAFYLRSTSVSFNAIADAIDGSFGREWGGTTSGIATAYTCTTSPVWTAYNAGEILRITPHTTNTGGATLNANTVGAKTIKYMNQDLVGGEIVANVEAWFVDDGTYWNLLNHGGGWATWSPTMSATGAMTFTTTATQLAIYQRHGSRVDFLLDITGTTGGTANNGIIFTAPIATSSFSGMFPAFIHDATDGIGGARWTSSSSIVAFKYDTSNFALAASRTIAVSGSYRVT